MFGIEPYNRFRFGMLLFHIPNMSKADISSIYSWITSAVMNTPGSLSAAVSETFGISRARAAAMLKRLTEEGWIVREGTTRPIYRMGVRRCIKKKYKLPGVDEQLVWERDFQPFFSLPANIEHICHHGFTEILNNANDHSEGTAVYVAMKQDEKKVSIAVGDNGIGIFTKIATALALPDKRLALLELSKGKLTTDPERHSGEGIFFTSRMFSRFDIVANDLRYTHDESEPFDFIFESDDMINGTIVSMATELESTLTSKAVFDHFASEDDFSFNKTVIPVRLAKLGNENLVSRSQAKRLLQRVENFRTVILDFDGIDEIGQAFADELFRVFANRHPEVMLVETNTMPDVAAMIRRVRAA